MSWKWDFELPYNITIEKAETIMSLKEQIGSDFFTKKKVDSDGNVESMIVYISFNRETTAPMEITRQVKLTKGMGVSFLNKEKFLSDNLALALVEETEKNMYRVYLPTSLFRSDVSF